jgi:hypothetical protein
VLFVFHSKNTVISTWPPTPFGPDPALAFDVVSLIAGLVAGLIAGALGSRLYRIESMAAMKDRVTSALQELEKLENLSGRKPETMSAERRKIRVVLSELNEEIVNLYRKHTR